MNVCLYADVSIIIILLHIINILQVPDSRCQTAGARAGAQHPIARICFVFDFVVCLQLLFFLLLFVVCLFDAFVRCFLFVFCLVSVSGQYI